MRQSLTAVLLLATLNAVADVELSEIKNNEVADAEVVMDNFNALKNEIESLPTPPTDCTTDQTIRWDGSAWVCTDMRWEPYSWVYKGFTGGAPTLTPLLDGEFYSFGSPFFLQFSMRNRYSDSVETPWRLIQSAPSPCFISLFELSGPKRLFELQVSMAEIFPSSSWVVTVTDGNLALLEEGVTYRLEFLGCS